MKNTIVFLVAIISSSFSYQIPLSAKITKFKNINTDYLISVIYQGYGDEAYNSEDKDNWKWEVDGKWNHGTKYYEDGGQEIFSYKIEYASSDHYIVNSYLNGGGSGTYLHLTLIKIKDGKIYLIEKIDGGDRCLGGVEYDKVSMKKGKLNYSINVTPNLLFNILQTDNFTDKFDDCCSCCAAYVNYQYDVKTKKKKLLGATLLDDYYTGEPDDNSNAFEIIFRKYVSKKMLKLSKAKLKKFIEEIKAEDKKHN